jgi:hypothetical protein
MKFETHIPKKHLTSIVKYYSTLDGKLSPTEIYIHRTLANHCPEIIFDYGSEFKEIVGDNKIERTFRTGIITDAFSKLLTFAFIAWLSLIVYWCFTSPSFKCTRECTQFIVSQHTGYFFDLIVSRPQEMNGQRFFYRV